jgi:DNA-binding response OmpR family regulator
MCSPPSNIWRAAAIPRRCECKSAERIQLSSDSFVNLDRDSARNLMLDSPVRPAMTASEQHGPKRSLTFDRETLQVSIGGMAAVSLTRTEFLILRFLDSQKGAACSRRQIIDAVHGAGYPATDRSVDVQIKSLRKKLGETGKQIMTVRNEGYRFRQLDTS